MRKYLLAALVVALPAPASDACIRGRAVARARSVTRTVTKPVRAVVAVPVKAVGVAVTGGCANGVCNVPAKK